ncbi:putative ion transporter superfamily protein YfcC [Shimia isoporae]|uniref:Putative ion transporter superfamily protein YfcC n=1 Tax=Shimia isoporae TaxID=647720 RepID=A0A4R1NBX8_9RHOB|nr:YfcC family protein [Shimia isoporae]TCL01193.1 putative ion transporter superfamily protein YfcC [Shimia isoporae]
MTKIKFPTAFTILFLLIAVVAALTWLVPAGEYTREMNETLGSVAPVPGTYRQVAQNPQGLSAIVLAPIAGLYDPALLGSSASAAIDVALFVLVIGGFLMVVTRTGAIDAGIGWLLTKLQGREHLMIPILMTAFALSGTSYGMAEESLAFYALIIPVFLRAGYDTLTAVAVVMLGAGIGTMGSTFNPFATVVASQGAGIAFTDGIVLRFAIFLVSLAAGIAFVMRYAARVKSDPAASLVANMADENRAHFLTLDNSGEMPAMTFTRGIILGLFGLSFVAMIYGVLMLGWWMGEMSALFLSMSVVVWGVGKLSPATRMDEATFVETFLDGARDLLGVALIIGVARGVVVVMDAGKITDTILFAAEGMISGLSEFLFINVMFGIQFLMSFLVPSSSGLATLTMPVMAPLADFAGVGRDLVVTAYQSANGLVNLFNPTFAVVMGGLAIGRVPYDRWLRFVGPLVLLFILIIVALLSIGAAFS